MYRLLFLIAISITGMQSINAAEDLKYAVVNIPDSLKANAKIVIRNWDQRFEFQSFDHGVQSISYAITILNENGLEYATFSESYSEKLQKVHSIKGTVYDASGKKIETLAQDKIIDQSMISGYSLYEDSREKYFTPRTMSYPFTVEYSYVVEYDGFIGLPSWTPIIDYNVSVQSSKYTIICPKAISFHYLEKNVPQKAVVKDSETGKTYEWNLENMVVVLPEPFSGAHGIKLPEVLAAPDQFSLEGYPGKLTSWKDLGLWINTINKDRGALPESTVSQLKELVKNCSSDVEKAKTIYEYMQRKTRYLNISIGIGGLQAQPAETVDRLGYGDCKALSNYTKSLLEAVGIKAYYTRIRAGDFAEDIDPKFPMNFSNHIILCVPLKTDTLWLECTNQHVPFGYTGSFTDSRFALLVSDEGGKLVRTRSYSANENMTIRNTNVHLSETGDAGLTINSNFIGLMYEENLSLFLAGTDDRKRMILSNVNLPGAELVKFNYSEKRGVIPELKENLELGVLRFATITGSRMLVSVVPIGRQRDIPKKVNNRKSDVVIRRPSIAVDTISIAIPEGFAPEAIPSEVKSESKFGSYSLKVVAEGNNKLLCVRRLELYKGTHPASTYDELVNFYKKIAVSDNTKVSLKRT